MGRLHTKSEYVDRDACCDLVTVLAGCNVQEAPDNVGALADKTDFAEYCSVLQCVAMWCGVLQRCVADSRQCQISCGQD